MRENRTYGSEGGEVKLPDPYQYSRTCGTNAKSWDTVGVDGPHTASMCQNEVVSDLMRDQRSSSKGAVQ